MWCLHNGILWELRVRPALIVALFGLILSSGPAAGSVSLVTNVLQLRRLANVEQRLVAPVRIEGTVWWSSTTEGRLFLQDDSGVVDVELDFSCEMPRQGEQVLLEGRCAVIRERDVVKIRSVPVVDNDGLHAATQKSGNIDLAAGKHPIRLTWFNRTDKRVLAVEYEGPGMKRQRIPDSLLFRAVVDPSSGVTNFASGLDYRCCEGLWWNLLPNLDHLPSVRSGVTNNFGLDVRTRDEHVALQFEGYLEVEKAGTYTFFTESDDGSCLCIGDPSVRLSVVGSVALPRPSRVGDGSVRPDTWDYQWAEVEGTVISVNDLQDVLEIELATGSGRTVLEVAETSDYSFTLVPQNRIRAVGVCHSVLRLDGSRVPAEFFVQSWKDIEQRYVTPDLWTGYPLLAVSNVIATRLPGDSQRVIHLRGKVIPAADGRPAFLEDASGRVALEKSVPGTAGVQTFDVLGRLKAEGSNRVLRCGFFRHVGETSNGSEMLPVLTTAKQVHQLSRDELNRHYPVKLHGVVTSITPGDSIVLQDTTRALFVSIGKPLPLHVSDFCEVQGTAMPGEFSPYISASKVESTGIGEMPTPVLATWDQLLNGSLQNQYVELEGVIIKKEFDTITLLTREGSIKVGLETQGPALPANCLNALVRLRGCLFVSWDQQTHSVDVGKIYLNQRWVDVVQPAPIDPFALPAKHVGDLLKFDPHAGALQRVKVLGQIIHKGDSEWFLMDGDNGLRFVPTGSTLDAHVRDRVEVVGFPDLSGSSPLLREAVVRRRGREELPEPRRLFAGNLLGDNYDSTLVRVEGVLLGVGVKSEGYVLEMQSGLRRFMAVVQDKAGLKGAPVPGSRLELTGVYVGEGGNRVLGRPIDSFQLLLNSGSDIRTLSRPPWWTLRRLLGVLGALVLVLAAALVWIKLLQRKVAQRTLQLETQIRHRQHAERQREIEGERARVAHDLHDDLGGGLTEVNMLTALANSATTTGEEKLRYLEQLNELALRMVNSLDEIVWAVNPRNDTLASLASYFGSYAQRFLDLASISCGLDVAEDLPDSLLDTRFRRGLFLSFKEALTNVVRHARATKVWLRILVQNNELVVIVADNGRGMDPAEPEAGADGLANMPQRLSALGGECRIQTEPGEGTTVEFRAPLPGTSP